MCFSCGIVPGNSLFHAAGATTSIGSYQALLSGESWSSLPTKAQKRPAFITYSFPTSLARHADADIGPAASTWKPFTASDKVAARHALKHWGDASGIVFLEAKGTKGDILFNWIDFEPLGLSDYGGFAYFPQGRLTGPSSDPVGFSANSGDIYVNTQVRPDFNGSYRSYLLLHEIGHALGLKHPFQPSETNPSTLLPEFDNARQTVMSYTDIDSNMKLGPLDLQAIRALYGSPFSDGRHLSGWSWNARKEVLTLKGKSKSDMIRGSSVTDVIKGGSGSDKLFGLAGKDKLHGGKGNDVLSGGLGRDVFVFDTRPSNRKNADKILDFDASDKFALENKVFAKAGAGRKLKAAAFSIGSKAEDGSDRIIYDRDGTGALYYDPDGTGPRPQVKFAQLDALSTALKASHFLLI